MNKLDEVFNAERQPLKNRLLQQKEEAKTNEQKEAAENALQVSTRSTRSTLSNSRCQNRPSLRPAPTVLGGGRRAGDAAVGGGVHRRARRVHRERATAFPFSAFRYVSTVLTAWFFCLSFADEVVAIVGVLCRPPAGDLPAWWGARL